ncbi:crotonase/enoyl-CoA hydratase family protein [Streptomyces sp. PSKA54]|uniref:Crotonase/enoyl-CoA hydratase family protein n=1 Tax=Streptomyces himalayensis subsp. aureolus TaxID=2758039 RepID=A0A7W2HKI0_9ACTN|nr:crotonase/enoyl-CoA hydratase family protein [Streptomyces himalayensis]MBA4867148.1 crotonase/enoyl-CoA hydratase family protein [Streptomyces himalayensis subsp. aureolus]
MNQSAVPDEGQITTHRDGRVLVITLDRPRRRNAMTTTMAEQLEASLTQLDEDSDLRVGVLTGAGGFFCAGQDLGQAVKSEFARTTDRGWFGIVDRPTRKPLIAAIEGFALAGGLEIALACDLLVAAQDAVFGVPEIRNGQVAAARGLTRLPIRLPYHVAAEMALTGDPVGADVMHEHGLLNRMVPAGRALKEAVALAQRIAKNPPVATAITLGAVRDAAASLEATAWARQATALSVYALSSTPEYQEGVSAFLEKRSPNWP